MMKRSIMSVILAASFLSSASYAEYDIGFTDDGLGFQCLTLDVAIFQHCVDPQDINSANAAEFWCGDGRMVHLWVNDNSVRECIDRAAAQGTGNSYHWQDNSFLWELGLNGHGETIPDPDCGGGWGCNPFLTLDPREM